MSRKQSLYLDDIFCSIIKIENYVENMSFRQFSEDQKTVDAVIRNFEIIGEATKRLSDEIKVEYPIVPWREMSGMRDKLIHAYFGVNLEIVWKTITDRIPVLKSNIQNVFKDIEKENSK